MICVAQRVKKGAVFIEDNLYSVIGRGLVLLCGFHRDDTEDDMQWMCNKILNLRVFENADGRFDLSLIDISGELLVVSQFTLLGDVRKGRRPDFTNAMDKDRALTYYERFIDILRINYDSSKIKTGVFKADMLVEIHNDGPVTIIIDSKLR